MGDTALLHQSTDNLPAGTAESLSSNPPASSLSKSEPPNPLNKSLDSLPVLLTVHEGVTADDLTKSYCQYIAARKEAGLPFDTWNGQSTSSATGRRVALGSSMASPPSSTSLPVKSRIPRSKSAVERPRPTATYRDRSYGPGPGSYTPSWAKNGDIGKSKYTFGGSNRSFIEYTLMQSTSPGPRYAPGTAAVKASIPSASIGKEQRFGKPPHNSPAGVHFGGGNPGPGSYSAKTDRTGTGDYATGPRWKFGTSDHYSPDDNFSKTVYMGKSYEGENVGVHGPGPKYLPGDCHQKTHISFSMRPKLTMEFDAHSKAAKNPGPAAHGMRPNVSRTGVASSPSFQFSRTTQRINPAYNLSEAPYISEQHAKTENIIHSPGPAQYYLPRGSHVKPLGHFRYQGHADRFYDPFETGRVKPSNINTRLNQ